jgi:hypothetical protein
MCVQLCGATEAELTCNVATLEIPPSPGARVRCSAGNHVPLPPELYELVQLGDETTLAPEHCANLCASSARCVVEPVPHRQALRPGEAISSTEPFVMCNTHYAGHTDVDMVGPLPSGRVASANSMFRARARTEAEYFSLAAYYEAESIGAFRRLALALGALGAPPELAARARRFAREEAAHCRAWLGLLAEKPGTRTTRPRSWPRRAPASTSHSEYELALENLLEGCVGESYGTWLALHQADHAESDALRRVARSIARDEAAHAALSFEIHAWVWPRLSTDQQRALSAAAHHAIAQLRRPLPLEDALAARLGAPTASALAAALPPLQALLRRALTARRPGG